MYASQELTLFDLAIPVHAFNTVVVGSGAAGLNAACRLFHEMEQTGVENPAGEIALVTQGLGLGTSNNSGSDKQTYYKAGTDPGRPDTALDFAATLTAGGCAHGDLALIEAIHSLRCFHHLADIGVLFPHTGLGAFVGYKTDHDPLQRGTSAGPWTSRYMVRTLLAELRRLGVPIFNRYHLLSILTKENGSGAPEAQGILCLDLNRLDEPNHGLTLFNVRNVVVAGGGPGELYQTSVYPKGQMGPYAAFLEAGARAENLTESQFGLASIEPRWNLSGTYQQVVPRYFSTDPDGGDEQNFLVPWFDSMSQMATAIFLKGYQWPFDPDKTSDHGSSLIDILVQNETLRRGRRVFLDFRENPRGAAHMAPFTPDCLAPEAFEYLRKSGAFQATPIERLAHANPLSIDLYKQMGVDLAATPLEIGVCAQHCNGGFSVDRWWESNVRHLFVIGELAGTHGVKRPGGAALNAGQVGGLRAAQRIAHVYYAPSLSLKSFSEIARDTVGHWAGEMARLKSPVPQACGASDLRHSIQRRMSRYAGMVRSLDGVRQAQAEAEAEWKELVEKGLRPGEAGLLEAIETREIALTQRVFLEALRTQFERGGGSRGSYLVTAPQGTLPHPDLDDFWRFIPENTALRNEILSLFYEQKADSFQSQTDPPRPLPTVDAWFEITWTDYREGVIFSERDGDTPVPSLPPRFQV
jgi:succinate dehydrogenase/fumarate reductase flavoprotein subunit